MAIEMADLDQAARHAAACLANIEKELPARALAKGAQVQEPRRLHEEDGNRRLQQDYDALQQQVEALKVHIRLLEDELRAAEGGSFASLRTPSRSSNARLGMASSPTALRGNSTEGLARTLVQATRDDPTGAALEILTREVFACEVCAP